MTASSNAAWARLSNSTEGTPGFAVYNYCNTPLVGSQCSYDMFILSPPDRPDMVVVGGNGELLRLIDALERGHIRHAGLDVFHAEPLRPDHPLVRMESVTLTSHAAFRTLEASMTLMRRAIDIVKRIVTRPLGP